MKNKIEKYLTQRAGGNSWAHNQPLIEAWRRRSFDEVPPLTMEFAPLLDCNANCPLCPYARSRKQARLGVVALRQSPVPNDVTVTTLKTARIVIDRAVEAGVRGVLWTGGGEPTIWEPLLDALQYSAARGLENCLYTNGFQLGLDETLAGRLMSPENGLVFVRMSVNALTPTSVRRHWGVGIAEQENQWVGLARLFAAREAMSRIGGSTQQTIPSIQISTIFDKNNIDDARALCAKVAEIASTYANLRGSEDIMVVRPLTIHQRAEYSVQDHDDDMVREIIRVCGRTGEGRRLIESAKLLMFLGFGLDRVESGEVTSLRDIIEEEYAQRDCSWSNGCFLTVGPGGIVYLSTAHNCDPKWALGDLKQETVWEIYKGQRRKNIVDHANRLHWGPVVEQPTARTNRLDRIARAIITGELTEEGLQLIRQISLRDQRLILD